FQGKPARLFPKGTGLSQLPIFLDPFIVFGGDLVHSSSILTFACKKHLWESRSHRCLGVSYFNAAFAVSHRAVKAASSWMAISESIFRFIATPAFFRPFIKVE